MDRKAYRRAQSGIELAVFFGFMMVLLIILSIEAADRMRIIQNNRNALEAEKAGGIAATNINIAVSVGDGYSSKFFMPYSLSNSNYSINITKEEQWLELTYQDTFTKRFSILTSNVTGAVKYGENRIRNANGEIILE